LHGEHKVGREEEICVVHGKLGGVEIACRDLELGADESSSTSGVSDVGARSPAEQFMEAMVLK
jgi:hypothetical protein